MDKTLHIDDGVHKRLTLYKVEHKSKSLSDAIESLLSLDGW